MIDESENGSNSVHACLAGVCFYVLIPSYKISISVNEKMFSLHSTPVANNSFSLPVHSSELFCSWLISRDGRIENINKW